MFDKICSYFNQFLSKHQLGFRKGHSPQKSLLLMVQKFKKRLENSGVGRMLLNDLSKVFDCLRHDLLIAKQFRNIRF